MRSTNEILADVKDNIDVDKEELPRGLVKKIERELKRRKRR